MILDEKKGDLLDAKEAFIAQQCNCVTIKSHGLSAAIAKRWPWADVYAKRKPKSANTALEPDTPGTIQIIKGPDADSHSVVCLFAQWTPGKPGAWTDKYPKTHDDTTAAQRSEWFRQCLKAMDDCEEIDGPVAVPYQIGCGLAGGNWSTYKAVLQEAKTEFVIYQL